MSFLFDRCKLLKRIHIINFDTSHAKQMDRIFCKCKSLSDINLSKFIVDKDISVHAAFWECQPHLISKIKNEVLYIDIKGRKAFK